MANFINYKHCKVHFTSQGKGRAVVLLHGFLENLTMWQDIADELSKHHRVICIDLLGHGETESLGYVHTMDEQAQMVKSVLNHLKLRKIVLVGHSMGGYVSMAFAKLYPQNVKGICLLNSTSLPDSLDKKNDRNRTIKLVKQNHTAFIKIAIPSLFTEVNCKIFKSEIQNILTEALLTSKQGIIASLEGMKQRQDLTKILQNENLKSLVFMGNEDTADKTTLFLKALNSKKNKVAKIHLTGKHMGFIENKTAVLENLVAFSKLCFK